MVPFKSNPQITPAPEITLPIFIKTVHAAHAVKNRAG